MFNRVYINKIISKGMINYSSFSKKVVNTVDHLKKQSEKCNRIFVYGKTVVIVSFTFY